MEAMNYNSTTTVSNSSSNMTTTMTVAGGLVAISSSHHHDDTEYYNDTNVEVEVGLHYTYLQQVTLVLIPVVTGMLSIIGSFMIIKSILFDVGGGGGNKRNCATRSSRKEKLSKSIYYRILLAMSIADLISTGGIVLLSSWAIPRQTPGAKFGNYGNFTTCELLGFSLHCNMIVGLYTSFLSFNFLLVVQYKKKEEWLRRYIEPIIHIVSIFLPLITGIVALHLDFINPLSATIGWCWFSDYPNNCSKEEEEGVQCARGENYSTYGQIVMMGTFGICWICIIVSLCIIVCKVRTIDKRMERYAVRSVDNDNSSSNITNPNTNTSPRRTRNTNTTRTQQAQKRAIYFISAFFITYFPSVALKLIPIDENDTTQMYYFITGLLSKALLPMQGTLLYVTVTHGPRRVRPRIIVSQSLFLTFLHFLIACFYNSVINRLLEFTHFLPFRRG